MKDYSNEFNKFFGGITRFLTDYCGYKLVKEGVNNSLCCPNHDQTEKNIKGGNCHSNDQKNVWFCYSCANTGNIHTGSYVEAVMQNLHMDKRDAFKWLCEKAGIQKDTNYEYTVLDIRKMFVEECHNRMMEEFDKTLEYNQAIQYLTGRGFVKRTIQSHRIGYSNSSELSALSKKGISKEKMIEAGLLAVSKKAPGKTYNPLKNRVVMMAGENIYGRDIRANSQLPHYYTRGSNSIFNQAKAVSKDGPRDIIFLVEAIFDDLTIEQFISKLGENWSVLATLGTKGVKISDLIAFLKRANPVEVIIISDSDPWINTNDDKSFKHGAGQVAGLKKAQELVKAGINTRILVLPDNSDPNDLSKNKVGASVFREMVNNAMPVIQYAIYCCSHYYNTDTFGGKTAFLNKIGTIINNNKVELEKPLLDFISKIAQIDVEEVLDFFKNHLKRNAVLEYFRNCERSGKSREEVFQHISQLLDK